MTGTDLLVVLVLVSIVVAGVVIDKLRDMDRRRAERVQRDSRRRLMREIRRQP